MKVYINGQVYDSAKVPIIVATHEPDKGSGRTVRKGYFPKTYDIVKANQLLMEAQEKLDWVPPKSHYSMRDMAVTKKSTRKQ